MLKKEKKLLDVGLILSFVVSMVTIIILSCFNNVLILLGIPLIFATGCTVYLLSHLINLIIKSKHISKRKDKDIIILLEQIKIKEKELLEEYSKIIIKYRTKSKQLQEKQNWIAESINELMRNYAEPIFEEQLKNIQNEEKENQKAEEVKKEKLPKTKSRKQ